MSSWPGARKDTVVLAMPATIIKLCKTPPFGFTNIPLNHSFWLPWALPVIFPLTFRHEWTKNTRQTSANTIASHLIYRSNFGDLQEKWSALTCEEAQHCHKGMQPSWIFSGIEPDDLVDNKVKKPGEYHLVWSFAVNILLSSNCDAH